MDQKIKYKCWHPTFQNVPCQFEGDLATVTSHMSTHTFFYYHKCRRCGNGFEEKRLLDLHENLNKCRKSWDGTDIASEAVHNQCINDYIRPVVPNGSFLAICQELFSSAVGRFQFQQVLNHSTGSGSSQEVPSRSTTAESFISLPRSSSSGSSSSLGTSGIGPQQPEPMQNPGRDGETKETQTGSDPLAPWLTSVPPSRPSRTTSAPPASLVTTQDPIVSDEDEGKLETLEESCISESSPTPTESSAVKNPELVNSSPIHEGEEFQNSMDLQQSNEVPTSSSNVSSSLDQLEASLPHHSTANGETETMEGPSQVLQSEMPSRPTEMVPSEIQEFSAIPASVLEQVEPVHHSSSSDEIKETDSHVITGSSSDVPSTSVPESSRPVYGHSASDFQPEQLDDFSPHDLRPIGETEEVKNSNAFLQTHVSPHSPTVISSHNGASSKPSETTYHSRDAELDSMNIDESSASHPSGIDESEVREDQTLGPDVPSHVSNAAPPGSSNALPGTPISEQSSTGVVQSEFGEVDGPEETDSSPINIAPVTSLNPLESLRNDYPSSPSEDDEIESPGDVLQSEEPFNDDSLATQADEPSPVEEVEQVGNQKSPSTKDNDPSTVDSSKEVGLSSSSSHSSAPDFQCSRAPESSSAPDFHSKQLNGSHSHSESKWKERGRDILDCIPSSSESDDEAEIVEDQTLRSDVPLHTANVAPPETSNALQNTPAGESPSTEPRTSDVSREENLVPINSDSLEPVVSSSIRENKVLESSAAPCQSNELVTSPRNVSPSSVSESNSQNNSDAADSGLNLVSEQSETPSSIQASSTVATPECSSALPSSSSQAPEARAPESSDPSIDASASELIEPEDMDIETPVASPLAPDMVPVEPSTSDLSLPTQESSSTSTETLQGSRDSSSASTRNAPVSNSEQVSTIRNRFHPVYGFFGNSQGFNSYAGPFPPASYFAYAPYHQGFFNASPQRYNQSAPFFAPPSSWSAPQQVPLSALLAAAPPPPPPLLERSPAPSSAEIPPTPEVHDEDAGRELDREEPDTENTEDPRDQPISSEEAQPIQLTSVDIQGSPSLSASDAIGRHDVPGSIVVDDELAPPAQTVPMTQASFSRYHVMPESPTYDDPVPDVSEDPPQPNYGDENWDLDPKARRSSDWMNSPPRPALNDVRMPSTSAQNDRGSRRSTSRSRASSAASSTEENLLSYEKDSHLSRTHQRRRTSTSSNSSQPPAKRAAPETTSGSQPPSRPQTSREELFEWSKKLKQNAALSIERTTPRTTPYQTPNQTPGYVEVDEHQRVDTNGLSSHQVSSHPDPMTDGCDEETNQSVSPYQIQNQRPASNISLVQIQNFLQQLYSNTGDTPVTSVEPEPEAGSRQHQATLNEPATSVSNDPRQHRNPSGEQGPRSRPTTPHPRSNGRQTPNHQGPPDLLDTLLGAPIGAKAQKAAAPCVPPQKRKMPINEEDGRARRARLSGEQSELNIGAARRAPGPEPVTPNGNDARGRQTPRTPGSQYPTTPNGQRTRGGQTPGGTPRTPRTPNENNTRGDQTPGATSNTPQNQDPTTPNGNQNMNPRRSVSSNTITSDPNTTRGRSERPKLAPLKMPSSTEKVTDSGVNSVTGTGSGATSENQNGGTISSQPVIANRNGAGTPNQGTATQKESGAGTSNRSRAGTNSPGRRSPIRRQTPTRSSPITPGGQSPPGTIDISIRKPNEFGISRNVSYRNRSPINLSKSPIQDYEDIREIQDQYGIQNRGTAKTPNARSRNATNLETAPPQTPLPRNAKIEKEDKRREERLAEMAKNKKAREEAASSGIAGPSTSFTSGTVNSQSETSGTPLAENRQNDQEGQDDVENRRLERHKERRRQEE